MDSTANPSDFAPSLVLASEDALIEIVQTCACEVTDKNGLLELRVAARDSAKAAEILHRFGQSKAA